VSPIRAGYLGPEGTFTQEALLDAAGRGALLDAAGAAELVLVSFPTIYDTVMAVHERAVERALVPIENSLEGSVNATLDALAMETDDVAILGEVVHPIRQCLIARSELELGDVEVVVSHPQANAQCGRFIRTRLPAATVLSGSSTADAVRMVAEHDGPWAAIGTRLAAERYGCRVLRAGVEDVADNETRFVWLGPSDAAFGRPGGRADAALGRSGRRADAPGRRGDRPAAFGPWKTAIVFWGVGSEAPGWLVSCLSEFASREVNLTRIESRPRKQGLGRYMFFADLEGRDAEPHVAEALEGLREHVEVLRVLGSFPGG
jgi:prephenate dehydratase